MCVCRMLLGNRLVCIRVVCKYISESIKYGNLCASNKNSYSTHAML